MTGRLVPDIRLRRQHSRLGSISGSAIDRPDEAIPSPGYGFNEAGTLSVVIQRRPKPFHGIVQALLEVHECVGRPQLLLQLFSGDGLDRTLQQHDQYVHRLPLKLNFHPLFAEFASLWIKLEHAKTQDWWQ